jgi:hypothetical protein
MAVASQQGMADARGLARRAPAGWRGVVRGSPDSFDRLSHRRAALVPVGVVLVEAVVKLAAVERTTIGGITIAGRTAWAGWPMLVAVDRQPRSVRIDRVS